jgi:GH35 family endo-1,4-beta-xylanase
MRWFIETYAGYFEGRIDAWDVVNEVFTDGGGANIAASSPAGSTIYNVGTWQRALRNNVPWYQAFANGADFDAGERAYDYIYYAYVFARRYAPSAKLIYNDFNEEAPHKRNAMANMVEELNERWHNDAENNPAFENPNHADFGRLLIEVIGMQAHYNSGTNMEHVRDALERFAQTGAKIHVTELDIHFRGFVSPPHFMLTALQAERQAEMFAQLFLWYEEFSEHIERVTIWGREDATSWRGADAATHFDRFYRAKPAFWAIYDPIGWRERI